MDSVKCRICGLNFLPELKEDEERHEQEHLKILAGAPPYEIREFLKKVGWEILKSEDLRETPAHLETAKRTIAFAYWARVISNSIPENELQLTWRRFLPSWMRLRRGSKRRSTGHQRR
jgi:hypothetical protein